MKKVKDEVRSAYKRADFVKLERGKFYAEVAKGSSVAILAPAIAKAFPTSQAVNEALSGLLALTDKTVRKRGRGRSIPNDATAVVCNVGPTCYLRPLGHLFCSRSVSSFSVSSANFSYSQPMRASSWPPASPPSA